MGLMFLRSLPGLQFCVSAYSPNIAFLSNYFNHYSWTGAWMLPQGLEKPEARLPPSEMAGEHEVSLQCPRLGEPRPPG